MPETDHTTDRREALNRKYVVARKKDIPEGSRIIVTVQGREIGIFNVDGTFHAILNRCPHRGGQLCKGDVLRLVESDRPGDVRLDKSKTFIVCPWHAWEFDIETGESWYDPERVDQAKNYPSARAFGVDVQSGGQVSDEIAKAQAAFEDCDASFVDPVMHRIAGPYQADIIPVEDDDEYVVVSFRRPPRSTT